MLGYWVRRLAEGGLVAALTTTSPPRLAHPDGGPKLAGTNPLAIGIPSSDGPPVVADVFEEGAERNKAMGVWGAVAGSGGAAGVLLGGMLTECAGWEWVLFVNVPIGIAAAFARPAAAAREPQRGRAHFDVAGAVTVTAGLSLLVYTLVDANDAGWLSGQTLGLGAIALALLARVRGDRARARSAPLVPFRDLPPAHDHRRRTSSALLVAMALFSMFFFVSLYMQQVLGYDALKAGLAYLPLALGIIVSAGAGVGAGDAVRLQAGPRRGHGADRGRAGLVRAGRRRTAPTSATSCSRRCWPRSGSASRSCR